MCSRQMDRESIGIYGLWAPASPLKIGIDCDCFGPVSIGTIDGIFSLVLLHNGHNVSRISYSSNGCQVNGSLSEMWVSGGCRGRFACAGRRLPSLHAEKVTKGREQVAQPSGGACSLDWSHSERVAAVAAS